MDEGQKRISRRHFLTHELPSLAVGGVILFAGCTPKEQATPPGKINRLPETVAPVPLPEMSNDEIMTSVQQSLRDFNKALDASLSEQEVVSNVIILSDLKEYQALIAQEETGYIPSNELDRPAITTAERHIKGKKIVFYKPAITAISRQLPNTPEGKAARREFVENISTHELVHYTVANYSSDAIHSIFFGLMLANNPQFKNKKIDQGTVHGAKVTAIADGAWKAGFMKLEEAEAAVISDLVIDKRGRPQMSKRTTAADIGVGIQATLLRDLLSKLAVDKNDSIKHLFQLRQGVGGREKLCEEMGTRFNVPPKDRLFFGLSTLFTIDIGDEKTYRELVEKQRPPINQ